MSHIRKNIQQAKQYEEEALFDYEYQKQENIVKERVRHANIRSKVMELANSDEWKNIDNIRSSSEFIENGRKLK